MLSLLMSSRGSLSSLPPPPRLPRLKYGDHLCRPASFFNRFSFALLQRKNNCFHSVCPFGNSFSCKFFHMGYHCQMKFNQNHPWRWQELSFSTFPLPAWNEEFSSFFFTFLILVLFLFQRSKISIEGNTAAACADTVRGAASLRQLVSRLSDWLCLF